MTVATDEIKTRLRLLRNAAVRMCNVDVSTTTKIYANVRTVATRLLAYDVEGILSGRGRRGHSLVRVAR